MRERCFNGPNPVGALAPGIIGQMCLRPSLHAPPHPPRAGRPDAPCLLFLMHIEGTCPVQLSRPRAHAAPAGTARAPAYRVMPAATHDPATRGPAIGARTNARRRHVSRCWMCSSLSLVRLLFTQLLQFVPALTYRDLPVPLVTVMVCHGG